MSMAAHKRVTVYVLSGFLGSGKTTLLTKAIDHFTEAGRKPAVIMNEIGEVNLDGQLIANEVPMSELLGGCICCSSRGDLATALKELVTEEQPDLIFIESTGIANPMEIIDEVTDASLILPVELKAVITVVDAPQLLELSRTSRGKTYRLMQEQIRCANLLLLNKADLLQEAALQEVDALVREWNPYASVHYTVFSQIDMRLIEMLEEEQGQKQHLNAKHNDTNNNVQHNANHHYEDHIEDQYDAHNDADRDHDVHHATYSSEDHELHESRDNLHHDHGHDHTHDSHHHHSHNHVMAYTHFFERAVDSNAFEEFVSKLPQEVYRAKGILSFSDTSSRFLFQYAYREMDFVKITPKGDVPDVAVFIGENFSKDAVRTELLKLESLSEIAAK
ncbi:G3E family GTPase [Paenibacillus sp. V4I3]|uniref:CobW family GTP-binding protein n=1 Tax=unclassified Paenibacillus TaxID=185978 RepID=UPI00277E2178|nr:MULTISPECIES: CobW family GTP-binding protein [unclassified Paenibacillus]MDQ0876506.1 G3E family GTPase [Paenibacillus sp. V4I3]MDQ0887460.1 G3E family GTPase [Paenibacillus sp. V4I9]